MTTRLPGFRALVFELFGGPHRCSLWLDLDIRTIKTWMREDRAPRWVYILARVRDHELGPVDPALDGWRDLGGHLYGPDGEETDVGEIRALPFMRQRIGALQKQGPERVRAQGPNVVPFRRRS